MVSHAVNLEHYLTNFAYERTPPNLTLYAADRYYARTDVRLTSQPFQNIAPTGQLDYMHFCKSGPVGPLSQFFI